MLQTWATVVSVGHMALAWVATCSGTWMALSRAAARARSLADASSALAFGILLAACDNSSRSILTFIERFFCHKKSGHSSLFVFLLLNYDQTNF
jgi:hypothetical protein